MPVPLHFTAAAEIQPIEFQNQQAIRRLAFSAGNGRPHPVSGSIVLMSLSVTCIFQDTLYVSENKFKIVFMLKLCSFIWHLNCSIQVKMDVNVIRTPSIHYKVKPETKMLTLALYVIVMYKFRFKRFIWQSHDFENDPGTGLDRQVRLSSRCIVNIKSIMAHLTRLTSDMVWSTFAHVHMPMPRASSRSANLGHLHFWPSGVKPISQLFLCIFRLTFPVMQGVTNT